MFLTVVLLCIALDQWSKMQVAQTMTLGSSVTAIPGLLDFTYVRNTGAAFSMLEGRQGFLIAFSAVAMLAMAAYVVRRGKTLYVWEKLAFALIVGGGTGNLICRAARGYVIDFINIHVIPIFNVADICVCCGCGLLLLSVLLLEPRAAARLLEQDEQGDEL